MLVLPGRVRSLVATISILGFFVWGFFLHGDSPDEIGMDLRVTPPRVDPMFLKGLLLGQIRVDREHSLYAYRIQVLDLRLPDVFQKGHFPFSRSFHLDMLQEEAGKHILEDPGTAVIFYGGDDAVSSEICRRCPGRVYELGPGWAAALDRIEIPTFVPDPVDPSVSSRGSTDRDPGSLAPSVTPADLKSNIDAGKAPTLIFVGPEDVFRQRHLPGAIRVPYDRVDQFLTTRDHQEEIVFYCGCCAGSADGLSGLAAKSAIGSGFGRVHHLLGHLKAWVDQGYPTEP